MPESNPLLRAALDYASAGWRIFPLKPRDKTPITSNGFKSATSDTNKIREWWTKTPTANIGLDCGGSGIVVVDLDRRGDGKDGFADWADLVERQQLQADTYTSLTGGGGKHLLFKAPADVEIPNSAAKLAPGIDVRGTGGYIVLPPSIHPSGKLYQWANPDTLIAPLPDTLIAPMTAQPDPWKIYTLKDAAKPRTPLLWLVERVLPMNSLSIWYGAPGTMKSLILADLAVCVAAGKRWLQHPNGTGGYATRGGSVLWLDFDNGQRRTHERFSALAASHQVPTSAPLHYVSMPDPGLDVGATDSTAALAARIINLNAQLVIVDNLGVISGDSDENSADMQRPMAGLRWLVEATGTALVVLHHQRKSSATPGATNGRAGDGLRGHGSIEAKLDYAVLINREDDNLTITGTKVRGPGFPKLGATFVYENDDAHELASARFIPYNVLAAASEDKAAKLEQEILVVLRKTPYLNATQICDRIKSNRAQLLDSLRAMKAAGVIGERQGPGVSRLLYVIE